MKLVHLALLLGAATAGLTACSAPPYTPRDWSDFHGPGAAAFQRQELPFPHVPDALEPLNRASAATNYAALRYGVAPLSTGYGWLLPLPAREALARAGENLKLPIRLVGNLLQGKLQGAGTELARFAVNSTVGVAGLWDPAQDWGLHPSPEDLGQAFAAWGWTGSTYLMVPLIGPLTVRDGLGRLGDTLLDPLTYLFPWGVARGFNSYSTHVHGDLRTIHATYDAYEPARTLYVLQREVETTDFTWSQEESGAAQTLGAIFLEPEDPDFAAEAQTLELAVGARPEPLPVSLWLQPEPAPLLFVVPGFGGHRLTNSSLALAEIGWQQGLSVVALSNPTGWEFLARGSSGSVPGFGPLDAADLGAAMDAAAAQLRARYPGRITRRFAAGLSMGAYQLLCLAALETQPESALERIVAINPPVDLEHAMAQLDGFYNRPMAFPEDQRQARIDELFGKVLYLSEGDLTPGMDLPFEPWEAEFLIGLAFRMDLQALILQSQELRDLGVLRQPRSWWRRANAFQEASEFSFLEYGYAFLLPTLAERLAGITNTEAGLEEVFRRGSLTAMGPALERDPRLRLFTNANDFLLRESDLAWLRQTLGPRLVLFDDGGHLGNLHREAIQEAIGQALSPGLPEHP